LTHFTVDSPFWQAIAYTAGTGGSIFIVGSAAGVALMSMEKVSFMWYTKHITIPALLTFFIGLIAYVLINSLTRILT
jgi:Na+/H+ antiporter NhaD/arsenite permease-like protein